MQYLFEKSLWKRIRPKLQQITLNSKAMLKMGKTSLHATQCNCLRPMQK